MKDSLLGSESLSPGEYVLMLNDNTKRTLIVLSAPMFQAHGPYDASVYPKTGAFLRDNPDYKIVDSKPLYYCVVGVAEFEYWRAVKWFYKFNMRKAIVEVLIAESKDDAKKQPQNAIAYGYR